MQRTEPNPLATFPWDDIQLFLVLYRSRTMGEAAKALGVNTSTVSRRLVALEEALDSALFDRGRDGLKPTRAAEELLAAAELVEQGVARFANAVDALERDVSGLVRVTCPPDVVDIIVLPVLRSVLPAHPNLRVALLPDEQTVDLNRREADLALRVVRPARGDLIVRRLLQVEWQVAASPALAERLAPIDDLSRISWIGWGDRLRGAPPSQWLDKHTAVEPVVRSDSLMTQIAAVAAGLGVALLPAPSIAHYGLEALELSEAEAVADKARPRDDLFIVTHQTLRHVPRVRVIWEALVEHAAEL